VLIDAYCHCGISKYKPIEDVVAAHRALGVDRAVLVQHLGEYDNAYLQNAVRAQAGRMVAVALIDHRSEGRWQALEHIAAAPEVRGVRVTDEILNEDLRFCVQVANHGLVLVVHVSMGVSTAADAIHALLGRAEHTHIVISHMGAPTRNSSDEIGDWDLLDLAVDRRVFVTLSGMSMWCGFPYHGMDLFVRKVIGAFGADRIMWGSNYSESGTVDDCRLDLELISEGQWGLDAEQVERIRGRTANQLWFGQDDVPPVVG
jgi:predicted TIM-barrel fold metal-dependent hydrolase